MARSCIGGKFLSKCFFLGIFFIGTNIFPHTVFSRTVDHLIQSLSIEEKIGQLFVIGGGWQEGAEDAIEPYHFGNAFFATNDVSRLTPQQIAQLSNRLQKIAVRSNQGIPLLVATDQEGGRVNRLRKGFAVFPGHEALGEKASLKQVERVGEFIGTQMRAVGVHVNFAPVVDVNRNEKSHVVRQGRVFSRDPLRVAKFARAFIAGHRRANAVACVKHFPGYGNVGPDPHEKLPVDRSSREDLDRYSLFPYRWLLENHSPRENSAWDMVMVGHVAVPALDADGGQPATASRKMVQELLRDEMGYEGVVVTDDLNMGAIRANQKIESVAVEAVRAGVDLLLFVGREDAPIRAWKSLVKAVQEGEISSERLDVSMRRILRLKQKFLSGQDPFVDADAVPSQVNTTAMQALRDALR